MLARSVALGCSSIRWQCWRGGGLPTKSECYVPEEHAGGGLCGERSRSVPNCFQASPTDTPPFQPLPCPSSSLSLPPPFPSHLPLPPPPSVPHSSPRPLDFIYRVPIPPASSLLPSPLQWQVTVINIMVSPPQSAPSRLPSVPLLPLLLLLLLPSRFSSPLFISPPSFPPSLPPSNTSVLLTGVLYFISRPNLSHRFVEVMLRRPPLQTGVGEKKRSFFFLSFFWGGGGEARGGRGSVVVVMWGEGGAVREVIARFVLQWVRFVIFFFLKEMYIFILFLFLFVAVPNFVGVFCCGGRGGGGGSVLLLLLLLLLLLDWMGCGGVFLYNGVLKCDNVVTQP